MHITPACSNPGDTRIHDLNWARTPVVSRGTRATAGETRNATKIWHQSTT